jgi:hypothetical protein
MEEPEDLVTPTELLEEFPELNRYAIYRLVEMGRIKQYPRPGGYLRSQRQWYLYSRAEVARAIGKQGA